MDVSASIAMANSREQGPWWERNVDLAAVAGGFDAKYGGRHFFGSEKYGFILEESVPPVCACGTGKNTTRLDSMQKMESLQEDEKMRNGVHENYLVICFCFLFVNKKMTVCLFSFFSNFLDLRTEKRSQNHQPKKKALGRTIN